MILEVRLFAVCRERAGRERVQVELKGEPTVQALRKQLAELVPALDEVLDACRFAVNQTFVTDQSLVKEGDEVAVIPPVSGGSGVMLAEVRTSPIEPSEVESAVRHARAGAVSSFLGTVRDHTQSFSVTSLHYEAYHSMAERTLRLVAAEVCERFPEARVAVLHRVGHLQVGEVSVAISVSSPHRAEAFEGCRHVIERLKEDAPIWKREQRADGSVWIGTGS